MSTGIVQKAQNEVVTFVILPQMQ